MSSDVVDILSSLVISVVLFCLLGVNIMWHHQTSLSLYKGSWHVCNGNEVNDLNDIFLLQKVSLSITNLRYCLIELVLTLLMLILCWIPLLYSTDLSIENIWSYNWYQSRLIIDRLHNWSLKLLKFVLKLSELAD